MRKPLSNGERAALRADAETLSKNPMAAVQCARLRTRQGMAILFLSLLDELEELWKELGRREEGAAQPAAEIVVGGGNQADVDLVPAAADAEARANAAAVEKNVETNPLVTGLPGRAEGVVRLEGEAHGEQDMPAERRRGRWGTRT